MSSDQLIQIPRISLIAAGLICLIPTGFASSARAQDIPGIENCMAEKAIDRRTGCLQSNVNYLKAMFNQLQTVSLTQIEADKRQIDALKASVVTLQATVAELKAAADKKAPDTPKPDASKTDTSKSAAPADAIKK
jgi:hypothetical protein